MATYTGSSNGVKVTVSQLDESKKITDVSVNATELNDKFDQKGAAKDVLGTNDDSKTTKTVYGAFAAINDLNDSVNNKINALDNVVDNADKGIIVSVKQENGKVTGVTVTNNVIGETGDNSSKNTIYGAKAAAADVLGHEEDGPDDITVYGAFAAIGGVQDCLDGITSITKEQINNLFCD